MRLHDIGPAPGSKKARKRVGRGPGSGTGKTCGRGEKGQKSRRGYSRRWGFEGGQMPLVRRVPKRGFTNIFREGFVGVNVRWLDVFEADGLVSPESLVEHGVIHASEADRVKILGVGEIDKPLKVQVHAISAGARKKIEAAGGQVELLGAQTSVS
jgi:large subunit ribosomal protein L15